MKLDELQHSHETYMFETVMRVRSTEIDIGQQLRSEALVAMFSEARSRFFYAQGIKEIDSNYLGILITDLHSKFLSRARAREELLFEVGVTNQNAKGGDIVIKVTRMYDNSDVAFGKFGFVCYNYITNQVVAMTKEIERLFATKNEANDLLLK